MIKVFAISILVTLFAAGCNIRKESEDGNDYHGFYPELYSIAVDSLLGARGYINDERRHDIEVTIMEQDKYGRRLFLYHEYKEVSRYSLLISQKSTGEYTYYYPDYNFISASENNFSEEEIEELKRKNDWDKERNLDKCKKIDIVRRKEEGPVKKGKLRELYRESLGKDAYGLGRTVFLTTDDYGRSLYLGAGAISSERYVVMLFNPDGSYDESKCVMELTDVNKYQDELKKFKELNDWNQPLEE